MPATADHPYLVRKGGLQSSIRLRVGAWYCLNDKDEEILVCSNTLIAPLMDTEGTIHSLQAIFPDKNNIYGTDKIYLKDGVKVGHFMSMGTPVKRTLLICEGVATGLSLWQCTDYATIVAFDSGQLESVCKEISRELPGWKILICADNDEWTTTPVNNPGMTSAYAAAAKIGALVVGPSFFNKDTKPTDFNDLHQLEGAETVRRQVEIALAKECPVETPVARRATAGAETGNATSSEDSKKDSVTDSDVVDVEAQPTAGHLDQLTLPTIKVAAGGLPRLVDEAEKAIIEANKFIYQRSGELVRV